MNLEQLFNMQKELDERILNRFPDLRNEDLLDKKILALQVELGELAQNWRGFKFWSEDQEPRTGGNCNCDDGYVDVYVGHGEVEQVLCKRCEGTHQVPNPLLEEYVDCLHFILSIGLELKLTDIVIDGDYTEENITKTFIKLYDDITMILTDLGTDIFQKYVRPDYEELFNTFVGLGEKHLGFTWEQIEQAYLEKNQINHERQENGY